MKNLKTIAMSELNTLIPTLPTRSLVLDVRSAEEFQSGHVPGALHIPHTDVLKNYQKLREYETIVVYCRAGSRATLAAMDLSHAGVPNLVCVNRGGMPEWEAAGLPVQR